MSCRANCWDNAPQESFFGHMKDELDLSVCYSYEEILNAVRDGQNTIIQNVINGT